MAFIDQISSASILVPFGAGLLHLKYQDGPKKIFFYLIGITVLTEMLLHYFAWLWSNNLFIHNIYILAEFTLTMLVFYHWLKNRAIKALMLISIPVFFIIWGYITYIQGIMPLNSISSSIECLILSFIAAVYLIQLMKDFKKSPFNLGSFWITTGVFIYFTSTTFFFGMFNYWVYSANQNLINSLAFIHSIINIFCNLLYAKGLWCKE
jgi:hypothetical protein